MAMAAMTESQRSAAKAVAWAYLLTFAAVVYVNFGIHDRLIVRGDAAATAARILAHPSLFRAGIVGDLFYCAGIVVQIAALFVLLSPVGRGLALLAVLWRFVWVMIWVAMTLQLADALRLLSGAAYVSALEPQRAQALARLYLGARFDYYYAGLPFGSMASTICAWLWLKSRYVPRALAVIGLVSSAWCVLCAVAFLFTPRFADFVNLWWFAHPWACSSWRSASGC